MTAVDSQDLISSLTPPSSELDEFEKTTLLTCSPSLPAFTYPSPTPSHRGHASSVSCHSVFNMLPGASMSSDPDNHHLQHLSFEDTSSDSNSFFPAPAVTDPSLASYTTALSNNAYMNQWYSYANYPQPVALLPSYDPDPGTPFTNFPDPSTHHGLANIIPPTPQDNQHTLFDFNTPQTTISSHRHYVASPSFSQISHHSSQSHRSSLPSLSRSCSPVPSLHEASGRTRSGGSSRLRPPLRSASTSSSTSLHTYGIPVTEPMSMPGASLSPTSSPSNPSSSIAMTQSWRCAFPGCTSRTTFTRGCDLRKHYNRHSKHLFCRVAGCQQSEASVAARAKSNDQPLTGGFSSKKDRARHEAKHNPEIQCEWRGQDGEVCSRVFSRMDNMKDHVRRIHHKSQQQQQQQQQHQHQHQANYGTGSSHR